MPKISIVIPVYNTQEYLEQCLDSVLGQTMADLEVICVDDCSKDSSYAIMERYHEKDPRVKIFRFDTPKSALQARKTGVMAAEGEYILFLDADDYLEPDACALIYEKICKENVDILQFSSRVENCANLPQSRIDSNQKLLIPCTERIEGRDVFEACFVQKRYFFTLWNKLIRASLCKKAFGYMEDKYLPKAQDLYSFFVIAYFAESYLGWETAPLHNYCLGRGVVASTTMNPDKFERYCTQVNVVKALRKFCQDQGVEETYEEILERYYNQWIQECVKLWKNELPKAHAAEGWEILCRYWGSREAIAAMAKLFWYQRTDVARKLQGIPRLSARDRDVKTVGIYYYHFTTGGVQRVMFLLAQMYIRMGYKVVIITDSEPGEEDFPVPEGAVRTCVYSRDNMKPDNVMPRLESWNRLVEEYRIDMMIYHAWTSNVMLWDFLYMKELGIPAIVHAHSVFSFAVNKFQMLFPEIVKIIPIADGLVVLSEADKAFWDAYVDNVYTVANPITSDLDDSRNAKWENKALIWVGRVSNEKQPWSIFFIMERVVRQVPEAKIYLLGNFDDPKWEKTVKEKNLEKNVIFCGMTQDVGPYYEKASIHLGTSKYEGFQMTLLESQAYSLPTVMFNMPHLTLGTRDRGVFGVDMADHGAAADEIVRLLTDEQHWTAASALAKQSYKWLREYDYEGVWHRILTGMQEPSAINEPVRNMIYTFVNHYEEGFKFQEAQKKQQKNQQMQIWQRDVQMDPISYKIGRFITFLPRKILGAVRCCKDHGFGYTVRHFFGKIKNKLVKSR